MSASTVLRNSRVASAAPHVPAMLFGAAVLAVLAWRWQARDTTSLTAETGFGYALGLIGVGCMLALLMYPLRKRVRIMRTWLRVGTWFRIHMMLGIMGPAAILVHCNFQWGALNSAVALFCMLLVVASGIIGRYIYGKIHFGLYGQKATRDELLRQINQQRRELARYFADADAVRKLELLHAAFSREHISTLDAMLAASRARNHKKALARYVNSRHDANVTAAWSACQQTLDECLGNWRRLAQLAFFDRMFSWWHILHLPIFVMMIVTAVIHVWAVHSY